MRFFKFTLRCPNRFKTIDIFYFLFNRHSFAQFHSDAAHGGDQAVLFLETDWRRQELNLDAFLDGLFNFFSDGGHFVDSATVEDCHVRAQAFANAGRIDGRVASADDSHDDVLAQIQLLAVVEAIEEVETGKDVGGFFTFHAQRHALLGAEGYVNSIIRLPEFIQTRVPAHFDAASEFYDLKGFKKGRCALMDIDRREVGPVGDKTLLHLQCHFGLDTLSWARRGANVTGVDFSEEAIKLARSLSAELEIDAEVETEPGQYELRLLTDVVIPDDFSIRAMR